MGGYTDGEGITLILSRQDLEFLLGGLSVLRAKLHGLADEGERNAASEIQQTRLMAR